MKPLKTAVFAIVFLGMSNLSLAQGDNTSLKAQSAIKFDAVYFQEWYTGMNMGTTGYNVFFPNVNLNGSIQLKEVYFRNLKAPLRQEEGLFVATLENPSRIHTFKSPDKTEDYRFNLRDNECVLSYVENGKINYIKVTVNDERAATYYKNGPPSIYENPASTRLAKLDEK